MKNLFVLMFLVFSIDAPTMTAFTEIPAKVLEAFKVKFLDAESVSWSKKGDVYLSTFDLDDQEANATFDQSGNWVESNIFVEEYDLPEAILDHLSRQYEMSEVLSARLHETPEHTLYHLTISAFDEQEDEALEETKKEELTFDLQGKLLKK